MPALVVSFALINAFDGSKSSESSLGRADKSGYKC